MVGGSGFSGKYCCLGRCVRAESVGLEAVLLGIDDDDLILMLAQEGAELCLYIIKLELPPCPRMRAIVSERRGLELKRELPYLPR